MHTYKQTQTEALFCYSFIVGSTVFLQTILEPEAKNSLLTSNISFCLCSVFSSQMERETVKCRLNQNLTLKEYSDQRLWGNNANLIKLVKNISVQVVPNSKWELCSDDAMKVIRVTQTFNAGKQCLPQNNMTFLPALSRRRDFPVSLSAVESSHWGAPRS